VEIGLVFIRTTKSFISRQRCQPTLAERAKFCAPPGAKGGPWTDSIGGIAGFVCNLRLFCGNAGGTSRLAN